MDTFSRRLLVLATPRSATKYMARLLRLCEVRVGHEAMKRDGTVGMFFAVEDCWYPGAHWNFDLGVEDESRQRRSDYEFEQVWHMVRDPRRVIPSVASGVFNPYLWCWQERHTGISCGLFPKTLRAMLFWVAWNSLIERNEKIDLFFRIEDIDERWSEISTRLGITHKLEEIPLSRDYNAHPETGPNRIVPLNWPEMEAIDYEAAKRVREMAERYGYDLSVPYEETL